MESGRGGVSWIGRGAAAVFLANTALGLAPPLPPVVRGSSLWGYVLKSIAILLAALETRRLAPRLTRAWGRLEPRARLLTGLGTAAGLVGAALTLRALWPDLFVRFSREEGPWETVSTACYLCALVLLWRVGGTVSNPVRGHLRLVGAGFAVLFLEEVDYAGIFGAVVGRVDGVYAGSLHDFLNLAGHGLLPAWVVVGLAAAGVAVVAGLWRLGWVRPALILRTLTSVGALWLWLGMGLLLAAALGEAGMLGAAFAERSPEEMLEMAGAVCLGGFALDTAADAFGWSSALPRRRRLVRGGFGTGDR